MNHNYSPYEIQLANEIASALNDMDSIGLHLKFARRYKEEHLRSVLARVLAMDEEKITRSRPALYVSIIQRGDLYGGTRY